jgi:mRNA interferase MazF
MKRGDIILVAGEGDYGSKIRPAVIVQSNLFNLEHPTFIILPITSDLKETPLCRIPLEPTLENGLKKPSQIMIDKLSVVKRAKIGKTIGKVTIDQIQQLNRMLGLILGLAE